MNTTMLSIYPKHFTPLPIQLFSKSQHRHVIRFPIKCSSSSSDNGNESQPNTVEIRIRRRPSKRQRQKEEEMINAGKQAVKPKPPPKDWESMNLTEKAIELYVGEKGLLFWLNKFAYASIFIIIGGWILFRFVGPAFDLYQLDTPTPLAPESMFKVLISFRKYFHPSNSSEADSRQVVEKYANALSIAMQFFDVQKSGKLVNNKIAWRGDSAMGDGSEVNLDLSRGMYDAGDHVKFGFPMAFTATVLSWAILEYGNHMNMVNELDNAHESLKWITDFLTNAHPSENVLYIQVGDPKLDHTCWERPEAMTGKRPLTQVNASYPGTDVAAESAAAMAAASLVFKSIDSAYSGTLLEHAKQLFKFADSYRGSYSISIPGVQDFYNSTGFVDELLWAAAWLYHATGDKSYLTYVSTNGNTFANWGNPSWFSWENKLAGVQVLLSRVNFFGSNEDISTEGSLSLQSYRQTAETFLCGLLPESPTATSQRTADGLVWVNQWNPFQYSVASSFLAVVYSDYMLSSQTSNLYCSGKLYEPTELRNFAVSQLDYILGNNPIKMSYLVGYGSRYPQQVHHRGASIPVNANSNCSDGFKWLHTRHSNPNVAVGALVGGPSLSDTYMDSRNNISQSEPTTYNSALIVGLISGLITSSSQVESFVKN